MATGVRSSGTDHGKGGDMTPQYPITVTLEDGTVWRFENEDELACSLEWCNTRDEEGVSAVDAMDRKTTVVVEAFKVVVLEVEEPLQRVVSGSPDNE